VLSWFVAALAMRGLAAVHEAMHASTLAARVEQGSVIAVTGVVVALIARRAGGVRRLEGEREAVHEP
jgi:hypothetical protein